MLKYILWFIFLWFFEIIKNVIFKLLQMLSKTRIT